MYPYSGRESGTPELPRSRWELRTLREISRAYHSLKKRFLRQVEKNQEKSRVHADLRRCGYRKVISQ